MAALDLPPQRPYLGGAKPATPPAAPGRHVSVQIMDAAARKRQADEEEAARKAALDEDQNTRANAALQLSQNADTRAAEADKRAAEDQARQQQEAVTKRAPSDLALEAVSWDMPEVKRKAFAETPEWFQAHQINKYGAEAPVHWDEANRRLTGNEQLGRPPVPDAQPGETIHQGAKGEITKQKTYVPKEQENTGATGEAALEGLTPDEANMVRQIANYELPATILSRLPGTQKMRILARVDQFEPTFAANEYPARQALKTSVKSGVIGQGIQAANTAVSHLNTLLEKSKALNNSSLTPWNAVTNKASQLAGSPAVTDFNNAANAVVSELAKVFRGAGSVSQQELQHWRENLSPNMSPEQIKGAVGTALELMGGRLSAIDDTWTKGMGKPRDFQILTPKARAILRKNGYDPDNLDAHGVPQEEGTAAPQADATGKPANTEIITHNGKRYEVNHDTKAVREITE